MYKQQNNDQHKYIEASKKERFALNGWEKYHNLFTKKEEKWNVEYTSEYSYSVYDMFCSKIVNGIVQKRIIIEAKNRTTLSNYQININKTEGWILEMKKYKALKEVYDIDPGRNRLLYICFTTQGTLVWDLSNLDINGNKTTMNMNKATMSSTSNKINKSVILLKEEDAKFSNYIFDLNEYEKQERIKQIKKDNKVVARKDIKDIGIPFDFTIK